jgi:polar amino acid transport system substrate-binding protein
MMGGSAGWLRRGLVSAMTLWVAGVVPAFAAPEADFIAYTEEWPPYNYTQNGQVRGIATDVLRAACGKAGFECEIEMVPWARAYYSAKNAPNALVYTTARKPDRENEFLWVGPIMPRATWVYGHPGSEKKLQSLKDLATVKVGIVRGEASQKDLEAVGVPASAFVPEVDNPTVLRQFMNKVVDVMVDTEVGMAWKLRDAGLPSNVVTRLMKLSDEGAYYYAVNLKSDPDRVRRLQQAIDALRRDGKIDAIAKEYGARKTSP